MAPWRGIATARRTTAHELSLAKSRLRSVQARRRPGLLAMDTTMTESAYPSVDVVDAKDLDRTLL